MPEDDAGPQEIDPAEAERWIPLYDERAFYKVNFDIAGVEPMEFSGTVSARLATVDMATAVVRRVGGPSPRDSEIRSQLYFWIGSITVAGGKIEAAMKRAILLASGPKPDGDFSQVDETWTKLEKDLRKAAESQVEAPTIAPGWGETTLEALEWGRERRAKKRRDDAVHAYWWDYADTNLARGRFFRSGESATLFTTFDTLRNDGETLLSYAEMLESLTGPYWMNLYLPRENSPEDEPPPAVKWSRIEDTDPSK